MATKPKTRSAPTGIDREELLRRLPGMSDEQKRDLILKLRPVAKRGTGKKNTLEVPQTDDELHEYVKRHTGYDIPRVAVCDDHCAPFDPIADAFFERESAILIVKSRESGGTLNVAILHYVNSECFPKTESITFGAIEAQAKRAFKYVKDFCYTSDSDGHKEVKPQIDGEPMRSETRWKNGSLVEIITGSKSGVNSPHSQKVHADEVDLMDEEVWEESRNISSSRTLPDGSVIGALDIVTSTRKSTRGLMQKLIDEVAEAEKQGFEPPWRTYWSCCFETAEEVPCCRKVPATERERRLAELGRDTDELCSCDKVVKGEWSEGVPRTLDTVCRGKFFQSRGWMRHVDIKRKFRQNSQAVWEAQMECRRPMADGLYLPGWTRERFSVRGWMPKPELGNIWQGVDWGGGAESAILWIQGPLRVPVKIMGVNAPVLVPRGAYMVFDEFLMAGVGATKLAGHVIAKEIAWRRQIPGFRVSARFADMAGRQQRDDWREHDPPLRTVWYISRDFDPTVKAMQGLVEDGKYWVDAALVSRHSDDIESWRQKNGREVHDESSHSLAAARYCVTNVVTLERRRTKQQQGAVDPVVVQRSEAMGPIAVGANGLPTTERWREEFDMPPGGLTWRQ